LSQTAQATRAVIEERREREYKREQDYYRFEELTNISERLSIPVETVIPFLRGEDGRVYSTFGDRVVDVVQKGYFAARDAMQYRPDIAFEVERRGLEVEEAHAVEAMQDGEVLMVVSPVPDAVRDGETTIGGYHRERLRSMVRLYRAQGDVIQSVTLSLDKSDYQGLQAVALTAGGTLPDGLGSEEILGRRYKFIKTKEEFEWLPAQLRGSYDKVLSEKLGGVWYGGAPFASAQDALSFVMQQPDLVDEHMAALKEVFTDEQKEGLRQRFAAAVDARFHGKVVVSLDDSIVSDTLSGGDYSGDCATGLDGTDGQMGELGMNQGNLLSCVTCPFCKQVVDAIKTSGGIQCPKCEVEVAGGKVIDHRIEREKRQAEEHQLGQKAVTEALKPERPKNNTSENAKRVAANSRIKEQKYTGVGEEITYLIDTETGQVIGKA
jgi:hypothetical protein